MPSHGGGNSKELDEGGIEMGVRSAPRALTQQSRVRCESPGQIAWRARSTIVLSTYFRRSTPRFHSTSTRPRFHHRG